MEHLLADFLGITFKKYENNVYFGVSLLDSIEEANLQAGDYFESLSIVDSYKLILNSFRPVSMTSLEMPRDMRSKKTNQINRNTIKNVILIIDKEKMNLYRDWRHCIVGTTIQS